MPKKPSDKTPAKDSGAKSQSEKMHELYDKLHGANAKSGEHPAGGPPNKPKGGGYHQSFGKHAGPKSGPPRRTQGKGG